MESPVRVFLIHRHRLLIDALQASLTHDPKIVLVGQTGYIDDARDWLADFDVDIVLFEADLDALASRPKIRELRSVFPEVKIIAIGLETNEQILQCIEAGACGYLPLEASLSDLVDTIRLIGAGKAHCSPELAVSVFARIAELAHHDDERSRRHPQRIYLTPREEDVLRLLGAGLRNKEIARELRIAVPTVKNHVHKILEKMNVKGRREAVRRAHEMGLLEVSAPAAHKIDSYICKS